MLRFSRLHSDSFLVYDEANNHIGELYRIKDDNYSTWRVIVKEQESGLRHINLRDAKKTAEHIVMSSFEPDPFDVGC
jgi:hypothetical protein